MKCGGDNRYFQLAKQGGATLVLLAILIAPWTILPAQGAPLDDLQRKQQEAGQQAQEYKSQATQKQSEVDDIAAMVNKIAGEIAGLQSHINSTERNIRDTEVAIQDTERQIKEKEAALAENQRKQAQALQMMYVMGRESTLETLIASESLSEVVARDQYLGALEEKIEQMMHEIKSLKAELESKRADLEKRRTELNDMRSQLVVQKQGLQEQKATHQRLLNDAKNEMNRLKDLAAEQSRIEAQVEAQIQAELAKLRGGSRVGRGSGVRVSKSDIIGYEGSTGNSTGPHVHFEVIVASTGQRVNPTGHVPDPFRWPLNPETMRITQVFGMTEYARSGAYGGGPHTGIDLTEYLGAPVRAAGAGEIILDQYYGGYGNAIIIDHGNGFWTLYGHMTGR